MGLGKTVSTLTALSDLSDSFAVKRTLIVGPLRVANTVWKQEAQKWSHTCDLSIKIATGTPKNRTAALLSNSEIIVINRENIPWLVDFYCKNDKTNKYNLNKWPFDCIVIDESSSFKSSKSGRFKAIKRILPKTEYMVLLTGTPAPNGLLDLWSQSYLIDQGVALGRNITAYRNRFFTTDYMGYSYEPRSDAKENIEALIAPYTLSMQAEDYLTLPSRLDTVVEIDIPLAAMKAYIEFKKEMYIDFHGNDFEALNAATLANKLLQFANGAVYTDELKNFSTVHDSKLDALKDIIDDNPNENILLAYNFKSDLIRLKKKFPELVVLSKEGKELEKWNCGKIKLMACHPASAGHGLNLQGGAAMMVWFGLNWSLELYQQFCARLHRQGQTRPVKVIHLIAKNTIDEKVMSVLLDKEAIQTSLLKALN
jgi:SNF2 family DNA or RNA helicase